MNNKLVFVGIMAIVAAVGLATTAIMSMSIPNAHAAQSCQQRNNVVGACVNANVAKNNICVGGISQSDRCTQ